MILLGVFALALIARTSVGANESMKNERAEKNVEVLRDGEVLTPIGGDGGNTGCRWATRETSSGWEAICIKTGVGYDCTCGSVKS